MSLVYEAEDIDASGVSLQRFWARLVVGFQLFAGASRIKDIGHGHEKKLNNHD